MIKSKNWITWFILLTIIPLLAVSFWTYTVDPYFHYHKPHLDKYYYSIYNQRSQNSGIIKNFDYNGIITGTSMTECFKTSEAESIFGGTFIKVPFSGGTYKEINDNLEIALKENSDIKIIIRGLDMAKFIEDKDAMRTDLGEYPTYLSDDVILNDVKYLLNRDVMTRVYKMTRENKREGFEPGITSFDDYSNWMGSSEFGLDAVFPEGAPLTNWNIEQPGLTEKEREMVVNNISQNVTDLAYKYPDVTFYYFFTPYSIAWWQEQINSGTLLKQLEAERITIEEILKCDNILLFSFNNRKDIIDNLDNYKDKMHYGDWINSMLLIEMKDKNCLLTSQNYLEYIREEKGHVLMFDYSKSFNN